MPAGRASATHDAAIAPTNSWPSAPMLYTRIRNATAAASPVRISGVAYVSVRVSGRQPCRLASNIVRYAVDRVVAERRAARRPDGERDDQGEHGDAQTRTATDGAARGTTTNGLAGSTLTPRRPRHQQADRVDVDLARGRTTRRCGRVNITSTTSDSSSTSLRSSENSSTPRPASRSRRTWSRTVSAAARSRPRVERRGERGRRGRSVELAGEDRLLEVAARHEAHRHAGAVAAHVELGGQPVGGRTRSRPSTARRSGRCGGRSKRLSTRLSSSVSPGARPVPRRSSGT